MIFAPFPHIVTPHKPNETAQPDKQLQFLNLQKPAQQVNMFGKCIKHKMYCTLIFAYYFPFKGASAK